MKKAGTTGELVLEIGTEEIPSGVMPQALVQLKEKAASMLSDARIPAGHLESFATPRRLVLHATGIPSRQEALVREVTGPPRAAAYDADGKPTVAAIGFAKSQGVSVESLVIKKTDRGEYVCAVRKEPTVPAIRILKDRLPSLISSLDFPKTMRWDGQGLRFARPIRWILATYDGMVVPFRLAGLDSGRLSRGHRFLANRTFAVKDWQDYLRRLRQHHVILEPSEREQIIRGGLSRLSRQKNGRLTDDADLLIRAVFLTEEPVVLVGGFDKKYLELPPEVPMTVMKEHQGYFPIVRKDGGLMPHFLFVSNLETKNPALIREGNERVLRARLEDARFYFEQDKKQRLDEHVERLSGLIFHEKLGTVRQKTERIRELAVALMKSCGRSESVSASLQRAAHLCKADLLTGMVREFPSLQGIIGREYARFQGEAEEVANAIAEHYYPRWADDLNPPKTAVGKFLTAADRLDSLVGFFGVDLIPSGSMDPYALRRQGLGLVQILIDDAFSRFSLAQTVGASAKLYQDDGIRFKKDPAKIGGDLDRFLAQRMETYLKRRFSPDERYRADLIDVVLTQPLDNPLDLYLRFVALMSFCRHPDFAPLVVAFKRASRIVPANFNGLLRPEELKEPVEQELLRSYHDVERRVKQSEASRRYEDVLAALALLRRPIDAFFDGVMVMDENPRIRENRLALLSAITKLFGGFGDFTQLVTEA